MLLGSKAAGYGHIQDPRFRYGRHCYSPKFPQHSRLSLWEAAPQWRCIQWTLEPPYYPPVFRKLRRIRRLDKRGEGIEIASLTSKSQWRKALPTAPRTNC